MKRLTLNNIGKKFICVPDRKKKGNNVFSQNKESTSIWGVKNINLEVHSGEIVGIIGRNGAGKTTLLKVIAGVIPPTEGEMQVNGEVASTFTLGAGFQSEFSGRENIYLNGNILGMSNQEITEKFQDILNFSELNQFIDKPLGTYSNGMRMRLGFSVAMHTDCDVFLFDENFLVGDVAFQKKCFDTLLDFQKKGKSIIFATQSLEIVKKFCNRVLLLEDGKIYFSGNSHETTDRYLKLLNRKKFYERKNKNLFKNTERWVHRMEDWGMKTSSNKIKINSVNILNKWRMKKKKLNSKSEMKVNIKFKVLDGVEDIHFGVAIFREDGVYCYGPNSRWDNYRINLSEGEGEITLRIKNLYLAPGTYYLSVAIWDKGENFAYVYHKGCYTIEVTGKNVYGEVLNVPYNWDTFFSGFFSSNDERLVGLEKILSGDSKEKKEKFAKITNIQFLDKNKHLKKKFFTGEELNIKVNFKIKKEEYNSANWKLWIGIFRNDGIYCEGFTKNIKSRDNNIIILTFPNMRFLPGSYEVSVGIWNSVINDFVMYSHKKYSFNVVFTKAEHGTVYLEHEWKWNLPKDSNVNLIDSI